jgi:hypothetical protein
MASLTVRPNGNLVLTVRITLVPGRDDDLIALIQAAPHGALARQIREAMRNGVTSWVLQDELEAESPLDMQELGFEL